MILKRLFLLVPLLFAAFSTFAQQSSTTTTPVTKDPQAVSLASASLAALSGTTAITDVTLTGTATRIAGSDTETGTVTLKVAGSSDSRIDLNLSNGPRSEMRNVSNSAPQGSWTGTDGVSHAIPMHNCMTDAAWFAPQLSVLSQLSDPGLAVMYVGQETRDGAAVQHLHFESPQSSSVDPTGLVRHLTAEDVYLDASSFLPVAITFSTHPDNDAGTDIPVEIDFSIYTRVKGAQIPFHVQKYLNGSLFLDLIIQSAVLNSGISQSAF
jgi:hypothetical protein